jgi:hypothetical protein
MFAFTVFVWMTYATPHGWEKFEQQARPSEFVEDHRAIGAASTTVETFWAIDAAIDAAVAVDHAIDAAVASWPEE